ncbi:MAG: hypothetical protein Q7S98_01325, partial [Deltaproteobacteria bacterium]|nr:hypothetical protein [Deltaproteobacteria bacterium]
MTDKQLLNLKPFEESFYTAEDSFRSMLGSLLPSAQFAPLDKKLKGFSEKVSGPWDKLATDAALNYTGPRIESYDSLGNPIDTIWLPPPTRTLRREVVEAGIFDNHSQLEFIS